VESKKAPLRFFEYIYTFFRSFLPIEVSARQVQVLFVAVPLLFFLFVFQGKTLMIA